MYIHICICVCIYITYQKDLELIFADFVVVAAVSVMFVTAIVAVVSAGLLWHVFVFHSWFQIVVVLRHLLLRGVWEMDELYYQ